MGGYFPLELCVLSVKGEKRVRERERVEERDKEQISHDHNLCRLFVIMTIAIGEGFQLIGVIFYLSTLSSLYPPSYFMEHTQWI